MLLLIIALAAASGISSVSAAGPPVFRSHTLAGDLKGGYQVVASDMNADGRLDLIALASGMPELIWFENPGWQRHVIARGMERMINLSARDLDGDNIPEILLAAGFSNDARKSIGTVYFLKHRGDPKQLWEIREIDRLPSSHRIRVAEFEKNKPVFVNAPLTGAAVAPPMYEGPAPLVFYAPPDWKRQAISNEDKGVVHGLTITDWDRDGNDDVLTAGFEGVHVFQRSSGKWTRTRLLAGDTSPWPKSGASDVAVGRTGKQRYLATVEPWHGNQIVVYTPRGKQWDRNVIDAGQADVHALYTADLNRDGSDDIVAAVRGPKRRVVAYLATGGKWQQTILDDGGIAAASCAVADLNKDGLPDLACIGSATTNLKVYENLGQVPDLPSAGLAVVEKVAGQLGFYSASGKRIKGVPVGKYPHEVIPSPDGKLLYVSDNGILWMTEPGAGGNTISVIDRATQEAAGAISLGEYRRPHGMDIDPKTNRMVVTVENPSGLLSIDLNTRKVLRKYDTKGPAPHMVVLSKDGVWAFVSNSGADTLGAVHLESGKVDLIPIGTNPQGGVLSKDGGTLFLTSREGNAIAIIDTRSRRKIGEIKTGKGPARAALTPDGKTLVYNLQFDDAVGFADVASRREVRSVPIGGRSLSLTLSKDGRVAYAGIQDQDKIAVISVTGRKLLGAISAPAGSGPDPALPLP